MNHHQSDLAFEPCIRLRRIYILCCFQCTPASTTLVERIFSASGEVTKGKRNHLPKDNLGETLVRKKTICFTVQINAAMQYIDNVSTVNTLLHFSWSNLGIV